MRKQSWILCVVFASVLTLASIASAEGTPSGTVSFESKSVGLGVGRTSGKGTLKFGADTYTFSITGLSLVDVGITSVDATGDVYHLKNVEDFSGTYKAAEAGVALVKGVSGTTMKNDKGVVLNVKSKQEGLKLTFGPAGMSIILKDKVSK